MGKKGWICYSCGVNFKQKGFGELPDKHEAHSYEYVLWQTICQKCAIPSVAEAGTICNACNGGIFREIIDKSYK